MFSTGQTVFAVLFLIAFIIVSIFVYRRDKSLHKEHYKGTHKVLIAFLLFIAFLFFIKGYLRH
ncbi:MAG TPA: hypothetical protein VGB50_10785 [Flavobacterium sp.]|jgi:cytochrome bd-type quinol oxidase subunit 1